MASFARFIALNLKRASGMAGCSMSLSPNQNSQASHLGAETLVTCEDSMSSSAVLGAMRPVYGPLLRDSMLKYDFHAPQRTNGARVLIPSSLNLTEPVAPFNFQCSRILVEWDTIPNGFQLEVVEKFLICGATEKPGQHPQKVEPETTHSTGTTDGAGKPKTKTREQTNLEIDHSRLLVHLEVCDGQRSDDRECHAV